MSPVGNSTFLQALVGRAASPYQRSSGFAWRFAKGKLARDPLFRTLLQTGAIPDAACLVDLGCGQALLALWLHAARGAWSAAPAEWPTAWHAPPKVATYLGVDQSRRDVARAKRALPPFARVFSGDLRTIGLSMLERCDVVTLFDVLHYLDRASQERLVAAIAAALPPWGVVVLRIGDGASWSSRSSDAVDWLVCALRGHPRWRLQRRSLDDWRRLLEGHGFRVEVLFDERDGGPAARRFANVLLRASRPSADTVPAAGRPAPLA